MFVSDIAERGYEPGTFKLGENVYFVKDKKHLFRYLDCCYCDNTGKILLKGREFKCPACEGWHKTEEVVERVVGESCKIKSILSFKNAGTSREIYTNDKSGYGLIIQKSDNGSDRAFKSIEEAQAACDKYNDENSVFLLLDKHRQNCIREDVVC